LPLQPDALASLAYYESLDMIKPFAASFGALEISGEVYKTEYVTRDKDGRFEVCKFKIASRNVFKLIALENGILLKLAETVKKD